MGRTETLKWRGVDVTIEPTALGHRASVAIPTRQGVFTYQCSAEIPAQIWDYLRTVAPEVASGDIFGDLGKGFSQMTRSAAFGQATGIISQVAQNPLFTAALGAVAGPAAVPIASTVGNLAGAAHNLATRARSGDAAAQRSVGDIARKAKAGDPKAQRAAAMIREAAKQQQQTGPRMDQALGGLASLLGPLAQTMAGPANAGDYASLVARFTGGLTGAVLDTQRSDDGSYQVASGADVQRNAYCGRTLTDCPKAYAHSHTDGSRAPWQFYGAGLPPWALAASVPAAAYGR